MPKARLVFDGDNVYIGKDGRIYGLKDDIATKIDGIPGVIDNLSSTSTTDALSANMGRDLQDQINAMSGIGTFLSTWDCTTGLPDTNPQQDPYTYKVGDYYIVSTVGATNYKPHGGTFTQGVPSTTVETENVGINDKYYFDGADWVRIPNTAIQITIDSALSTSSTNAVENRAIANAVNAKQDIISDLSTIRNGAAAGATAIQPNDNISQLVNNVGYQTAGDVAAAIAGKQDILSAGDGISITSNTVTNTKPGPTISGTAPANPTEGMLWYDSTNDVLKVYDGSAWQEVGSDAADINTKTFRLSSLSDLTTAQAIWDFFRNGGNPIIKYSGRQYFQTSNSDFLIMGSNIFASPVYHTHTSSVNTGISVFHPYFLQFNLDQNNLVVESVQENEIFDLSRLHVLTTDTDYQIPYTPQYDGSPATKKYVDDSVADVIPSGGTAPQNPQEGDLWYDTVNDKLMVYDGANWIEVGSDAADINTKTFYLSSSSDLTTAQAAYDWYIAGKNPIVIYDDKSYTLSTVTAGGITFESIEVLGDVISNEHTRIGRKTIVLSVTSGSVTSISTQGRTTIANVLATNQDYSSPYVPQYNGSPATKKYVDDSVDSVIPSGSTAPQNPQEGDLWYDTTVNILKVYNATTQQWENTGKEYTAGEGIEIKNGDDYSAMRGPCNEGFHIPLSSEWQSLLTMLNTLQLDDRDISSLLYMPYAGERDLQSNIFDQNDAGCYWASDADTHIQNTLNAYVVFIGNSGYGQGLTTFLPGLGFSIRPFKDEPAIPPSSTPTADWSKYSFNNIALGAAIWHNTNLGVVSITVDGTNFITIADKNVGATTVYTYGDTLSGSNCGYYFQWGNNSGFPIQGNVLTDGTQVDASGYGPGNYYSSNVYIIGNNRWDSSNNANLWGGITGITQYNNAITNTRENIFVTQAQYDALPSSKTSDGNTYFIYSAS